MTRCVVGHGSTPPSERFVTRCCGHASKQPRPVRLKGSGCPRQADRQAKRPSRHGCRALARSRPDKWAWACSSSCSPRLSSLLPLGRAASTSRRSLSSQGFGAGTVDLESGSPEIGWRFERTIKYFREMYSATAPPSCLCHTTCEGMMLNTSGRSQREPCKLRSRISSNVSPSLEGSRPLNHSAP